jgi:hypothetical protein
MRSSIIAAILLSAGTVPFSSAGIASGDQAQSANGPQTPPQEAPQGACELEAIVVIAQKRSEDAQRVPAATHPQVCSGSRPCAPLR